MPTLPTGSPFLRSPPFPWVAARVGAVSRAGISRIADTDALIAAIQDARVGGDFWRADEADLWRGSDQPIRATPGADAAIVAWLRGAPVTDESGAPVAADRAQAALVDRIFQKRSTIAISANGSSSPEPYTSARSAV